MPHTITTLPKLLTALAFATWATACDTEDDIDDRDRIAEDEDLELADDELEDEEEDEPGASVEQPDDLVNDDVAQQAKGGNSCTISDDNGPLEGGTVTVTGCEPPMVCFPVACGGYSCWGTCQSGGGIITPK